MPEDLGAMLGQAMPEQDLGAMPEQGLEDEGRVTDSIMGHLTIGEIIIPPEVLTNLNLVKALEAAFTEVGSDISQYTVGSENNSINPNTGYPEFFHGRSRRRKARRARAKGRQEYLRKKKEAKAKFDADMAEFDRLGEISRVESQKALGSIRAKGLKFQKGIKDKYSQIQRAEQSVVGVAAPSIPSLTSKKFSKKKYKRITKIARQGRSDRRPA